MQADLPHRLSPGAAGLDDPELVALQRAAEAGLELTPLVVVPRRVETDYYRLNNLPDRLVALFRGVDLSDPDEDDLEEIAPEAQRLVASHALLEEVVEALYAALGGLAQEVVVRRAGAEGERVATGRPALLALKRVWCADWGADALAERLLSGAGLAPEARPVLLHEPTERQLDPLPASLAPDSDAAWVDAAGRLTRLSPRRMLP
jgi:hypothetical protein